MSLQTNLRPIRERQGFGTQRALAKASGVSLKSIADYERGQAEPTLSKLLLLADALACGLDELVGRPTPAPRVIVNDVRYVPDPPVSPEAEPANGPGSAPFDLAIAVEGSAAAASAGGHGKASPSRPRPKRQRQEPPAPEPAG